MGVKAFNVRAEELETQSLFRDALEKRRAVVPASGYDEWQTEGGIKTPHFIYPGDGSALLLACCTSGGGIRSSLKTTGRAG